MNETAAELRQQAHHARQLAERTFESSMKVALLEAAQQFEAQAKLAEEKVIRIGPKLES